jgi:hypothetical protein
MVNLPALPSVCGPATVVVKNPDGQSAQSAMLLQVKLGTLAFTPATMSTSTRTYLLMTAIDTTGQGWNDIAAIAIDTLSIFKVDQSAAIGTPMDIAISLTAGTMPRSMIAAKSNSDSFQDLLLSVDGTSTGVIPFSGTGTGSFTPQLAITHGVPSNIGIAASALDNSGEIKLVEFQNGNINSYSNTAYKSSTITYVSTGKMTPSSGLAPSMISDDFNGDMIGDLSFQPNPPDGSVLTSLGDGNNGFMPPVSIMTGLTTTSRIISSDINQDGKKDLAVFDSSKNSASILINSGNGIFSKNQVIQLSSQSGLFQIADLDCDGYPDLVYAKDGGSTLNVILNSRSGSYWDPNKETQISLPNGSTAHQLIAAKFDPMGRTDVAILTNPAGATMINNVFIMKNTSR